MPEARFALEGPVEGYLQNVTRQWLLPAPEANPAMLAMFRDRDRRPYRDLLPWSGEFAGKYLTGATGVLRLTGDPELKRHLERFVRDLIACQDADGYLGPFPRSVPADRPCAQRRREGRADLGRLGPLPRHARAACSGTRRWAIPRP